MLARPSPLTQYLPHEYAIVVSSERQAGDGCFCGRNKLRMLRAKRLERAPGRLRHSRRLHHRCDGGPLVSRWDASSSSAPPTPRARSLLICERRSQNQGVRRSWSMSTSPRRRHCAQRGRRPSSRRRAFSGQHRSRRGGGGNGRGVRPVCVDPRRHRCHARNWRRRNLHCHQGHAIASDRRAKADDFNARRRRCRPLCRCRGHIDDALGHRPGRSQQHQPHRAAQRGVRHRRHGQRGAGSRHWQAADSADHVWRNDASPLSPSNSGTASIASYFMQPEPVDARWKNSPTAPSSMA